MPAGRRASSDRPHFTPFECQGTAARAGRRGCGVRPHLGAWRCEMHLRLQPQERASMTTWTCGTTSTSI